MKRRLEAANFIATALATNRNQEKLTLLLVAENDGRWLGNPNRYLPMPTLRMVNGWDAK